MDNRLVLTVLFVTLSWISVGTYAQNTTTASTSMTTASTDTTTASTSMTTASTDTTTASTSMTTASTDMTTASTSMTTASTDMTTASTDMTTASTGMTTASTDMTTASTDMTTASTSMTTASTDMTGAPDMTTAAGNNTTAAPITTAAPPLTPNTTVGSLDTPISRTGCGTVALCAAEPAECEPSATCFFLKAKLTSGNNFEFALSGESDGYLAATLSTDTTLGGNDTTYVCANDNGTVKFFSTVLDNGQLIEKQMNVNSVKGNVNGTKIQCTFAATVPVPTTRASTFSIAVSTGPFNTTNGVLGSPRTRFQSAPVDLLNPNVTITNTLAATTTAPNTTSHGVTLQQSLTQAVLFTVGVFSLAML